MRVTYGNSFGEFEKSQVNGVDILPLFLSRTLYSNVGLIYSIILITWNVVKVVYNSQVIYNLVTKQMFLFVFGTFFPFRHEISKNSFLNDRFFIYFSHWYLKSLPFLVRHSSHVSVFKIQDLTKYNEIPNISSVEWRHLESKKIFNLMFMRAQRTDPTTFLVHCIDFTFRNLSMCIVHSLQSTTIIITRGISVFILLVVSHRVWDTLDDSSQNIVYLSFTTSSFRSPICSWESLRHFLVPDVKV